MEPLSMPAGRSSLEQFAVACGIAAMGAAILVPVAAHINTWLGGLIAVLCFAPVRAIAQRVPRMLVGARRRRPVGSGLWCLLLLVAVIQMARLSAFMVDSSRIWGATVPDPVAANHQCLAAYVQAGDLCRRGERNVYDEGWYPAFTRPLYAEFQGVSSPVEGLGHWVQDPYEYPPPFLLLPRAALAITNSFEHIRTAWFVIQSLSLLIGSVLLVSWIGGREGVVAGLLIPAIFASIPTMLNFQFGQFHAMAIMLAVGGMVAFDTQRRAWGGALLSFAVLSKIFPGLLLITLAAQRRWRDVGWTLTMGTLIVLIAVLVLGTDPFIAFVSYQLPRLASGAAFSFIERPDVSLFIVSRNFSIHGVVAKLHLLGVTSVGTTTAQAMTWAATVLLLWLAWTARAGGSDKRAQVMVWLGLLNLGALRSPVAPSAYVTAPMLWLLALLAGDVRGRYTRAIALAMVWLVIMGPPPLPDRADLMVGLFGQALALALGVWVLTRPRETSLAKHAVPAKSIPV